MTTASMSGASAAAPWQQRLSAQLGAELRLLLRNGENLLVTIGIPVGLLAFFSTVPVIDFGAPAVDFLLPGMLVTALMGSAMVSLGISTGFERSYLVLKRLGATPLTRVELVAAKILAVLAIQVLQVLVLVAVALLLGWPVDQPASSGPAGWLTVITGLVLGTAAYAGLGLAMAGSLRATATLALTNALFIVLLLASGLMFPLDALPAGLGSVLGLLPSTALARLLRAALSGATLEASAFALLAAWAVGACALAAKTFRWE